MEPPMRPVIVKTFPGATPEIAAERFAADAVVATRLGYAVTSQVWDGTKLTVVYQRQVPTEAGPVHEPPQEHAEANAQANAERAEANARANSERAQANEQATRERAAANSRDT